MLRQNIFPRVFTWYVTLGALFSLSVSYSADITVPVTVTNRTAHYLHVLINKQSFTYVAPGIAVRTEVKTDGVIIQAVYSPGQGRPGAFEENYPTTRTETSDGTSCNSDGSCESTGPQTTTTPVPVQVELFPQNLR